MVKLGAIKLMVAIAPKDDAVRPVAVLIGDVPVVVHRLETDEQVIALERALACDRSQHRQEEGVDHRFVGGRILEKKQSGRVGSLRSQARGILVDGVVELARNAFDVGAGRGADRLAAAQRARHRGLRDARQIGDVETRRLGGGLAPHVSLPGAVALAGPTLTAETSDWSPRCQEFEIGRDTSELQSLMRNSYAVFCLKKKK